MQPAGVLEALNAEKILPSLQEISLVDKNGQRVERRAQILKGNQVQCSETQDRIALTALLLAAGGGAAEKPHIFMDMPFCDEMVDVFICGIQDPVQEAGFLCKRFDRAIFNGDILEQIKSRIETARLVIADLSGANANVYLELGYSWGHKVPVLLVCRQTGDLMSDVQGQRCLFYTSINDLKKQLSAELKVLGKQAC